MALCSTPRVGATVLLRCLRGANPGAAEWPDATPVEGRLVTMIHATQLPVAFEGVARWVWLRRRDRHAQCVSWAVAAASGHFHSDQDDGRRAEPSLDDLEQAWGAVAAQDRLWADRLAAESRVRECWYEDWASDPRVLAAELLRWAGHPGTPAAPALEREDGAVKAALVAEWRSRQAPWKPS